MSENVHLLPLDDAEVAGLLVAITLFLEATKEAKPDCIQNVMVLSQIEAVKRVRVKLNSIQIRR